MNWYNGYSPKERYKKLREHGKLFPSRSHPYFAPPCHMCGDPSSPVMPHSEDYSEPFLWERPAEYALCKPCHSRIHKRFNKPFAWEAYKLHLRRGGYGSDLKIGRIARQMTRLAKDLAEGKQVAVEPMRPVPPKDAWWEALTTDPASLTAPWARKR